MLEVEKFIKENKNWKELLTAEPYCLKISEADGLILLKYNQIYSDFSLKIVRECRGIIFYEDTMEIACLPFYKFFNYGETYADEIDWSTARISEKMDGSLIKVFYRKDKKAWWVSTNGSIDADKCPIQCENVLYEQQFKTYGELFRFCLTDIGFDFNKLNKNYAYMFELCSPYNRVVIKYDKPIIYHIGTRDMTTLKEVEEDIGVVKPREYFFNSLSDCVECSRTLVEDQEGYVVRDAYFRRLKIKNPTYVLMHHMANNNRVTLEYLLKLIIENESSEFLSYFPEYSDNIKKINNIINSICEEIDEKSKSIFSREYLNRKEFALAVLDADKTFSSFYFKKYDGKGSDIKEYILSLNIDLLRKIIAQRMDK